MRRIVSLWFPDFAVERFIRGRIKKRRSPPPPGLPFALVEGGAKGLRLAAVNLAARRFGLGRGQRLADARAQVPDLLSEPHEAEEDLKSLLGLCRPWQGQQQRHHHQAEMPGQIVQVTHDDRP